MRTGRIANLPELDQGQEQVSTARRVVLTGGAVGLAALAGAALGTAQPASAQSAPTWVTPSGDTTGNTDTANIQTALDSGGALLSQGQFYIKESTSGQPALTVPAPGGLLVGCNNTLLTYLGNTQCIWSHSTDQGNGEGGDLQVYPADVMGIQIAYLDIDGTSAGSNAVGLDVGDGDDGFVWRVRTSNFEGASQYGMLVINRYFYTEKWRFYTQHFNCQNPVVIGSHPTSGGTNSFMYNQAYSVVIL